MITKRKTAIVLLCALFVFLQWGCGEEGAFQPSAEGEYNPYSEEPFDTLYRVFGPESDTGERDRNNIWAAYRGKTVTWRGALHKAQLYKSNSMLAEFVHHRAGGKITGMTKLELPLTEREKVFSIIPGQPVKYQGRLQSFSAEGGQVTFYLTGGKIIEVINTP